MLDETENQPDIQSGDENADLFRKFRKWYREDSEHASDWRKEAAEDYDFVASEQWSEDDKRTLQDNLRPVITFNRIDPLIRSVSGEQINNQQEVRYLPREEGDARANELLTSAAMWFRDQCDADDEESEAFWDACVCGVGATETRLDTEDDPDEPTSIIERIDPLELLWDCNARKRNLSDARRLWRVKQSIPIDDAKAQFPDHHESDLDAGWTRLSELGKVHDSTPGHEYDEHDPFSQAEKKDTVTIVQVQWYERRPYWRAADPFTGEMIELEDEGKLRELSKKVKEIGQQIGNPTLMLESVKLTKKVYRQAFLGRTVLKVKDSPCPDHFTFNFITGFRDRNKGTFYGLVRGMKDPQRWANKWLSQTLHIMNSSAKGGIMAEKGAVENERDFEKSWAKTEAITWVEDGANTTGKIVPKPGPQFPNGFLQLMEFAISSIRDVAGINLEMLGMREAGQAASLEYQRRQAGITILATLFRSMRRYHRNQGKVLLYFIQNYLSDNRLIRIVGEEGAQYVPLARQADIKYDIVVDEGPTSPNQKERVWSLIGQRFFDLPPKIQLALLKYSPFPESVIEEVKKAAQQESEGPQAQMQQKMMEFEAQLKQMDAALRQAQVAKTQVETQKLASEIGQDGDQGQMARLQADVALKRESKQIDTQLQREGMSKDIALTREKNAVDMEMQRESMANENAMRREEREVELMAELAKAMIAPKPEPGPPRPAQQ